MQNLTRRAFNKLLPAVLLFLLSASTALSATRKLHAPAKRIPLTRAIPAILAAPDVARAHWGISVVDMDNAHTRPVYALNDGQLFAPASNAKLFTTAAALALLGPDFRLHTYVVAQGKLSADGHLAGTLRLVGGGDPTLSGRAYPYAGHTERSGPPLAALDELAAQVVNSGIRALDGSVVGDDTLFAYERYGQGWAWDDLQWEYGAPVSALTVNDNVRYLTITPGSAAGDATALTWDPDLPPGYESVTNNLITAAAGTPTHVGVDRQPWQGTLRLYGTVPAGGKPPNFAVAMTDPAAYAAAAFASLLSAHGLPAHAAPEAAHRLTGDTGSFLAEVQQPLTLKPATATSLSLPALRTDERIVAQRTSLPLSQIVTVVNKVSQNLHAEILLRVLGAAQSDEGSVAQGARVVRQFLTAQAGVNADDFIFFDGSGLSPEDQVTPRSITTLLAYAAHQGWGTDYRASLPVGGIDGSLARRFNSPGVKGRVQAKTGTLAEVNALSGYIETVSGKHLAFSILCNDRLGDAARAAMDRIVETVAAQ